MNLGKNSFKRNNDLTEVFDQKYKANHGNNERVQQEIKDFNRKIFGIKDKEDIRKEMRKSNSVEGQVNSLNQRMNCMNPRMGNVNNINGQHGMNNMQRMNNNMRNNFR